jgi:hypothetical protein
MLYFPELSASKSSGVKFRFELLRVVVPMKLVPFLQGSNTSSTHLSVAEYSRAQRRPI